MMRAVLPVGKRALRSPGCSLSFNLSRAAYLTRSFADSSKPGAAPKASIQDSRPLVLPGSSSTTTASKVPPPPGAVPPPVTAPSSSPIRNVPLTPSGPPGGKTQTSAPVSVPPPNGPSEASPPPPPPPKPRRNRFRRLLVALIVLSTLGFGGSVWASLLNDNFHDFFTEYIPFGEETVLFFEEREFRKRFPNALNPTSRRTVDTSAKITIPSKSGLSSTTTQPKGSDLSSKSPHMSALNAAKDVMSKAPSASDVKERAREQVQTTVEPKDSSVEAKKAEPKKPEPKKEEPRKEAKMEQKPPTADLTAEHSVSRSSQASEGSTKKGPEVDQPSVYTPLTRLDPINIKDADEPLVQDLVKMLNDIITVVNADNGGGKFNTTIAKAKSEISAVGKRIQDLKAAQKKVADERVSSTRSEFDQAAQDLVRRLETEMSNQEAKWRDEMLEEKQKMSKEYEDRLSGEIGRAKNLLGGQTKNQLLEQAIALKRDFEAGVKARVEAERDGRLGKLSELSNSHKQLEKLTADWNAILEDTLKTQHLQVAVEAVRSSLERSETPRPFIKELAALKELSADDTAVNSAIASIHPSAYQYGVPTNAQLIDRFRRVADEVRKASLLPDDAGIASHAASLMLSKVMFRKQDPSAGGDVESVLTRTKALLEEGNLDHAAREMNALNGWAKTLSEDWLSDVRKVLEVRQALDVISTEARLQSLKVD